MNAACGDLSLQWYKFGLLVKLFASSRTGTQQADACATSNRDEQDRRHPLRPRPPRRRRQGEGRSRADRRRADAVRRTSSPQYPLLEKVLREPGGAGAAQARRRSPTSACAAKFSPIVTKLLALLADRDRLVAACRAADRRTATACSTIATSCAPKSRPPRRSTAQRTRGDSARPGEPDRTDREARRRRSIRRSSAASWRASAARVYDASADAAAREDERTTCGERVNGHQGRGNLQDHPRADRQLRRRRRRRRSRQHHLDRRRHRARPRRRATRWPARCSSSRTACSASR